MGRRTIILVFVVALAGVAAMAAPGAAGLDDSSESTELNSDTPALAGEHVDECAAEPPDDFADPEDGNDVIGWVDGYWYNEPLDVDGELENPLSEEELEELVPRTAARVEALRCLAFDEVPPLDFTTTEDYQEEIEESFEQADEEFWEYRNAQLATQFILGQGEDALERQAETRAGGAAAFYNFGENFMAFIVEDPDEFTVDQVTLAHELVHALQDQHFNLSAYTIAETDDEDTARTAVVEGGATHVDSIYQSHCEDDVWAEDCLQPEVSGDAGDEPSNWALSVEQFAPYSTPLVADIHAEDGWDGVSELYENPPQSTVEAIHSEKYGEFELADISVPDQSTEEWERMFEDPQRTGQHSLTAMLVAPLYEAGFEIVSADEFLLGHAGGDLNFGVSETNGWTNDHLYAYQTDDGDLGSVWKLAWESEDDAERFAESYLDLADYRGAENSDEYENAYVIDSGDWDMAFALEQTDDRLWIVTAPTVDDLTAIHDVDLVEAEDDEPTPTPDEGTPTPTPDDGTPTPADDADDADDTPDADDADDTADADDDGAGFGIAVGAVAVLLATLVAHRRR